MRLGVIVLVSCFSLAMVGAASGASAQSALPNGYGWPEASAFNDQESESRILSEPHILVGRQVGTACELDLSDDGLSCDGEAMAPEDVCASSDESESGVADAIDPLTGAVTCGANNECYLGTTKIEVVAGGKRASFSGRTDCALDPTGCLDADGEPVDHPDCSFTGQTKTAAIHVNGCWEDDDSTTADAGGFCLHIPHTSAAAKRRHLSTVANWKVSFNGESIGSGRLRISVDYHPAVKAVKGRFITTKHPDWKRQFCRYAYGGGDNFGFGPAYFRCWVYGTPSRPASWDDEALKLSGD